MTNDKFGAVVFALITMAAWSGAVIYLNVYLIDNIPRHMVRVLGDTANVFCVFTFFVGLVVLFIYFVDKMFDVRAKQTESTALDLGSQT